MRGWGRLVHVCIAFCRSTLMSVVVRNGLVYDMLCHSLTMLFCICQIYFFFQQHAHYSEKKKITITMMYNSIQKIHFTALLYCCNVVCKERQKTNLLLVALAVHPAKNSRRIVFLYILIIYLVREGKRSLQFLCQMATLPFF